MLSLCRWTDIVRHEPGGYTVGGGKLTLPAAHGDFFGNAANTNPNMLLQKAPAGPFTMETRLAFNPNENYEQAGPARVRGRRELRQGQHGLLAATGRWSSCARRTTPRPASTAR